MWRLIPAVAVPINISCITRTIIGSVFKKRGSLLTDFNKSICSLTNFKYSRTFQSGYLALYTLLEYLKQKNKEREVILSAYTCPSVLFAVKNAGLIPVFVDVDINDFNVAHVEIEKKVNDNTLVIIAAHMFGCFCDIGQIRDALALINRSDVIIIEDLCQSLTDLTQIKNDVREYGDFGILSFGRAKTISTLNGGALVTNCRISFNSIVEQTPDRIGKISTLISQVIKLFVFSIAVTPLLFRISNFLLNRKRAVNQFNLNDYKNINHDNLGELQKVQVALGIQMLKKIEMFNQKRRLNWNVYENVFVKRDNIQMQRSINNIGLRFPVLFSNSKEKSRWIKSLYSYGIVSSSADYPVLPTIEEGFPRLEHKQYPNASRIASEIMTFPTHPILTNHSLKSILKKIQVEI